MVIEPENNHDIKNFKVFRYKTHSREEEMQKIKYLLKMQHQKQISKKRPNLTEDIKSIDDIKNFKFSQTKE